MPDGPPPISHRIGRLVILLYPPAFRRRHGADILAGLASVAAGRSHARWRAHVAAILDLLAGAAGEWRDLATHRMARCGAGPRLILERMVIDSRLAARRLRRAPLFTAVAVLTVMIGIGASTAVFSLVDEILLRPLPYERAEDLVFVWSRLDWYGFPRAWVSGPQVDRLRRRADLFDGFAALDEHRARLAVDGVEADDATISVGLVSGEMFRLLGVDAMLGRVLRPDEEGPGADPVMVLGYELWRSRFGADADVIGRTVQLDGAPYAIVGVMPADFRFAIHSMLGAPRLPQAYVPLTTDLENSPTGNHSFALLARLRAGASPARAQAQVDAIASEYGAEVYRRSDFRFAMTPVQADLVKDVRPALLTLAAAVGLVLLLVAVNLATLYIGRVMDSRHDSAIRIALGGGGWARVGVTLMETMWVAALGGALGIVAARWAIAGLVALAPARLPRAESIGLDARVAGFGAALALLLGLVVALAPMLRLRRVNVSDALQAGGRTVAGGSRRAQTGLVVAQIAMAGVLLFSAVLIGRTFIALWRIDPGFRSEGVLLASLHLPDDLIPDEHEVATVIEQLRQRLLADPAVRDAGFTDFVPLSAGGDQNGFSFAGAPGATGDEEHDDVTVDHLTASAGYFRAVGVTVIEGRGFTDADTFASERVVVIDEALARRFWPRGGAVGGTVRYFNEDADARIVGVIRQPRRYDVRADGRAQIYSPLPQRIVRDLELAVLTDKEPRGAADLVRAATSEVAPRISIDGFRTLGEAFDEALAPWRFMVQILALFSTASLLLAALGIYGAIAVSVSRRSHEIGVRMALGARASDIGRAVLGRGLGLGLAGALLALGGSAAVGQLLAGFLFDVAPLDPVSLTAAVGMLGIIVLLATAIPARRAMRVSPIRSLRSG